MSKKTSSSSKKKKTQELPIPMREATLGVAINRMRPNPEELPTMTYEYEKKTKTIEKPPMAPIQTLTLLPSSLTDKDIEEARNATREQIHTKVGQIMDTIREHYAEKIISTSSKVAMTQYFDPSKFLKRKEQPTRPPGVVLHDDFPIKSIESLRIKGRVTEALLSKISKIQQSGDIDMHLALLRYWKRKREDIDIDEEEEGSKRKPHEIKFCGFN